MISSPEETSTPTPPLEPVADEQSAIYQLLFNFPRFAKRFLDGGVFSGPVWFIFIFMLGAAGVVERIEMKNAFTAGAGFGSSFTSATVFGMIIGGGLIGGFINYYVQGGIYHILVLLSGGKEGFGRSANIHVYAMFPIFAYTVLDTVFWLLLKGDAYWSEGADPVYENLMIALTIGMIAWAIANRYRASRLIQGVSKVKGIIFLTVLPGLFYAAIFGGTILLSSNVSDRMSEPYSKGLDAYTRGHYEDALRHYRQALNEAPNGFWEERATIYRDIALSEANLGNYDAAEDAYRKGYEICPEGTIERSVFEGSLALYKQDVRRAIAAFKAVIARDPENFVAHNELGIIFLGEYDEAYLDYEKAEFHNRKAYEQSGDVVTQTLLARTLYFMNEYEESEKLYRMASEFLPGDPDNFAYLGLIGSETGQPEMAVSNLEKCFELDPTYKSDYLLEVYESSKALTSASD